MANNENQLMRKTNDELESTGGACGESGSPGDSNATLLPSGARTPNFPNPDDFAQAMPRPNDHPADKPWPPKWREYPADHLARKRKWTPDVPFNEEWTREDFGNEYVDKLFDRNSCSNFRGDWWLLAMLMRCTESACRADGQCKELESMKWWRLNLGPLRDSRLGIHLENADLSELRLEYADLRAARLDHAVLHGTNLRHADIRKACLNHADLSAAVLEYADLSHADLDGAELSDARLEHAKFNRASLDYADLQFARLDHANFTDARLGHARFWRARLTHSNFGGASLKNANFCYAQLEHADFTGAGLELASFWFARLEHTNLRGACLTYARLPGARLDHADVRGATGILFDENPVDGLHIEGNAPDPWSLLRRKYTGPRFFFHLILLIAFLLPFAARVLILSAHSQMYETAERIVEHAGDAPGAELWAKNMADWTEKYRQTHDKTLAVWVLAGWTKGWHFFGLTLVLVMYNLLRAYLTSKVSMLRDAEERSKITPALVDYYGLCHPLADLRDLLGIGRIVGEPNVSPRMRDWPQVWWRSIRRNGWRYLSPVPVIGLYRVHLFARVLFWAAMGSFAYNAIAWLSTTWVWVPKS